MCQRDTEMVKGEKTALGKALAKEYGISAAKMAMIVARVVDLVVGELLRTGSACIRGFAMLKDMRVTRAVPRRTVKINGKKYITKGTSWAYCDDNGEAVGDCIRKMIKIRSSSKLIKLIKCPYPLPPIPIIVD